MFLKICGITRHDDARHAVEEGATALGFVFWPRSPRHVSVEVAEEIVSQLPAGITAVGVFVNESITGVRAVIERTRIHAVQLHGDESPEYADVLECPIFRAVNSETAEEVCETWPEDTTLLVDGADSVRRGGTGTMTDWIGAAELARRRRVVLAGGLTPDNVADAIDKVQPFGVDVASGVERSAGVKDWDKVTRFLSNARRAFEKR
jgi:phosphoribosylanthranilate isomerase